MNHLSEEQLILHHYGEVENFEEISDHLVSCPSCQASFQSLQRTLAMLEMAPLPERSASYATAVWERLGPQIADRRTPMRHNSLTPGWTERLAGLRLPRWVLACGTAMLLFAVFLAGRFWPATPPSLPLVVAKAVEKVSTRGRERILLKEIGDHLEHAQVALIELINNKTNGAVDISLEQTLARQLVDVNRLYRQTAAQFGEGGIASVLEDLERTLIEISNSRSVLPASEFAELRRRLDTDDMLFRVKVVSSLMRAKEKETVQELAGKRS